MTESPEIPAWYVPLVARQREMNAGTWQRLQAQGVSETSQLRLDFQYEPASKVDAERLADYLRRETDYEVNITRTRDGVRLRYAVRGKTQSTIISRQVLDQWVTWMINAGVRNGHVVFDGWGTSV